jgi:hypothetical protein
MYQNTFKYTPFLQKRFLVTQKQLLESGNYFLPIYPQINLIPVEQQQIQLLHPLASIVKTPIISQNPPHIQLENLNRWLEIKNSIIQDFISYLSKDEYQFNYIMNWLANFFQTLNKSSRAIILIGDSKTTDILINSIIKPIFAYKKEYFSVVNTETLKKSNDTIIKDKIFYHIDTDNLSQENIRDTKLSNVLLELIKPNSLNFEQAIENNEMYIHGETIVTSSNESPYPFLKDSYSRCSVFNVTHIDTILNKLDVDMLELEEYIQDDLDNFSNILAQYQTRRQVFKVKDDKKNVLPKMKKGILITPDLEEKIRQFINAIKEKNISYFSLLKLENDENLYKELVENFDNDLKIPAVTLEGLEELDYLNNRDFSQLINMQADATIEAINDLGDIPCDVITIDGVCETSIGSLMYEYELLTSLCAKFMYINAYDQPGVEGGKIILKQKLKQN